MKRLVAGLLIVFQLIIMLPVQSFAFDETTTVIIHYQEAEGNTTDWNLWIWPFGSEGSVYYFDSEDNYGKVATIVLPGKHEKVGFIVRTDSWEKDVPNDRFIEKFDNGVGEVWLKGGVEEVLYENPNGPAGIQSESVDLTVNYHNYFENYSEVNITAKTPEGSSYDVPLSESAFGVTGTITIEDTLMQTHIDVLIEDGQSSEYAVLKIKDGVADVYLVQNNERVYYSETDAVYKPAVVSAKLSDTKTIQVETNMPFVASEMETMVTANGNEVAVASLLFEETNGFWGQTGVLKLSESVNYTDELTVTFPGFETAKVVLGEVFDTLEFNAQYNYDGELGPIYSKESTTFKVWAPTAKDVNLTFYSDHKDTNGVTYEMTRSEQGVWEATVEGDLHNQRYAYNVLHKDEYITANDPYARAVAVNGIYSAVVDLDRTNPSNWDENYKTNFTAPTDAIMYEIHVRDLSMHAQSGIENKGLFLGFTETDTTTDNGFKTGVNHIKDLGVTHVQFLPIYDYGSINELVNEYKFNWGYDPMNYNALEGSYSTDARTPDVRINEFKQAVQALHDEGLKVTMDVVYNHVYNHNAMAFDKLVPGYYFRKEAGGNYANGSGCGNETASERYMMRKFMVDSVTYLATEYNLDGFRFDLMGLHDVETMNAIRTALNEIDPSITIIGEGWNMGIVLDENIKANQNQAHLMPGIAHFNDTIRDGLKGSVFDSLDQGFVSGKGGMAGIVFTGIVGGVQFGEYSTWGDIEPSQSVTYVEAHDNNTLYDKLVISNPDDDLETIKKMHMLADSIILTSQGVSFIHAGQEFLRTKFGDHNSYQSSDIINRLDWSRREKQDDVVEYFKGLIDIRKTHIAFRMPTKEMINEHLSLTKASENLIHYTIKDVPGDEWDDITVVHNANREDQTITLEKSGKYALVVTGEQADAEGIKNIYGKKVTVPALTTYVLVYNGTGMNPLYIGGAVLIVLLAIIVVLLKRRVK